MMDENEGSWCNLANIGVTDCDDDWIAYLNNVMGLFVDIARDLV